MSSISRDSRRLRNIYKRVKLQAQLSDAPCAICGQPIAWDARDPRADDAPSVDHVRPWSTHPELRADPANLRVTHNACNKARGARAAALPSIGNASRRWGRRMS
nr:MAG TPA: HNH endonuclease [Caudoviricetes sp.]